MYKTLLLIFFLVFSYCSYAATGLNVWAWGSNDYGAYGNGTYTSKSSPEQIGIDSNWAIINAGYNHTLAIKNDGTLWAWGYNSDGELGDGSNTNKSSPEQIGSSSDWAAISGCERHTVALKTDGTLWAWGDNTYGELGDGTNTSRNTPEQSELPPIGLLLVEMDVLQWHLKPMVLFGHGVIIFTVSWAIVHIPQEILPNK